MSAIFEPGVLPPPPPPDDNESSDDDILQPMPAPPAMTVRPVSVRQRPSVMELLGKPGVVASARERIETGSTRSQQTAGGDNNKNEGLPNHSFNAVHDELRRRTPAGSSLSGPITANRLPNQLESLLFTFDSVQRASRWMPQPGDVVIASSPNSGQSLVERAVRLLSSKTPEEFDSIIKNVEQTAPWIECGLVDYEPEVLSRPQPGTNRVFRTAMAHSMLSTKINACPQSKFIAVFRDPLHLRAAFYEQIKAFFVKRQMELNPDSTRESWLKAFSQGCSLDDIVDQPVTLVQKTPHSELLCKEYEYNLRDWIAVSSDKPNVLILFAEEMLAFPDRVVRKIAKFIERERLDYDRIIQEVSGQRVVEFSRRNSTVLLGVGSMQSIRSSATSEDSISVAVSQSDESALSEMSPRAIQLVLMRWADVFGSRAPMYQDVYESIVKDKYPFTMPSLTMLSPTKGSRLSRHISGEKSSALRSFRSQDSRDSRSDAGSMGGGDETGSTSTAPRRKTIISRLFRSVSNASGKSM